MSLPARVQITRPRRALLALLLLASFGNAWYGFVASGRDDSSTHADPSVPNAEIDNATGATRAPAAEPSAASGTDGGPSTIPEGEDTVVESITDGDTFRVEGGTRIRVIGIDTPELAGAGECYATEAAAHLTELTPPGTPVRLVFDVDRTDRFGRTLAYVYRLPDGLFVNLAMAADGYAVQLTVPPNILHVEDISRAVADARDAQRGLWAACSGVGTATSNADTASVEPLVSQSAAECDPSYPEVCIPPGPLVRILIAVTSPTLDFV